MIVMVLVIVMVLMIDTNLRVVVDSEQPEVLPSYVSLVDESFAI